MLQLHEKWEKGHKCYCMLVLLSNDGQHFNEFTEEYFKDVVDEIRDEPTNISYISFTTRADQP